MTKAKVVVVVTNTVNTVLHFKPIAVKNWAGSACGVESNVGSGSGSGSQILSVTLPRFSILLCLSFVDSGEPELRSFQL